MSLASTKEALILELSKKLDGWKFVKSKQSFQRKDENCVWSLHLVFINHASDFDVTADVAVEHLAKDERVCIVGAELGNIRGTGQQRWKMASINEAARTADSILEFFVSTGIPFLQRYSSLQEILRVLRTDAAQARLICPLVKNPQAEADFIEKRISG